jgi:hypothetical protein
LLIYLLLIPNKLNEHTGSNQLAERTDSRHLAATPRGLDSIFSYLETVFG